MNESVDAIWDAFLRIGEARVQASNVGVHFKFEVGGGCRVCGAEPTVANGPYFKITVCPNGCTRPAITLRE